MALEIEIFPKQMPPGGSVATTATPQASKPLSASFAEMMAAVEAGDAATPAAPAGPKPLSANFAEMMAAADGAAASDATATAPEPRARDLDPRQRALHTAPGQGDGIDFQLFGEDGLTFGDLIDVINPLQHIPIVGTIYRWLTGDEISPASSLAGGFLFGGPIGLAASAVNVVIDEATGDDIGGNVMTAMFGESPAADGGGFDPDIELDFGGAPERSWGVADATPGAAGAPQVAGMTTAPEAATQAADAKADVAVARAAGDSAATGEAITLSEDQLAALLAAGSGQRTLNPLPPPGAPAKTPRIDAIAPAAGATDGAGVATNMMSAMDKYEAMLKARAAAAAQQGAGPAGAVRVSA